jgi:hypothetical protein
MACGRGNQYVVYKQLYAFEYPAQIVCSVKGVRDGFDWILVTWLKM